MEHKLNTVDLRGIRKVLKEQGNGRGVRKTINIREGLDSDDTDLNWSFFDDRGEDTDLYDDVTLNDLPGYTIRIGESGIVTLDVVLRDQDGFIVDYTEVKGTYVNGLILWGILDQADVLREMVRRASQ